MPFNKLKFRVPLIPETMLHNDHAGMTVMMNDYTSGHYMKLISLDWRTATLCRQPTVKGQRLLDASDICKRQTFQKSCFHISYQITWYTVRSVLHRCVCWSLLKWILARPTATHPVTFIIPEFSWQLCSPPLAGPVTLWGQERDGPISRKKQSWGSSTTLQTHAVQEEEGNAVHS